MIKKHHFYLMDLKQSTLVILCMLWFSFTTQANNEELYTWSRIGPEGANINQLVISPSHPDILHAATTPASFYSSSNEFILKSLNGGDSWVTLPWQGMALSTHAIIANQTHQQYSSFLYAPAWQDRTLAIDPDNPDIVFTSLSGFLLKTSNSGMSWHSLGADIDLDGNSFFLLNSLTGSTLSALVFPDNTIAHTDEGEHWVLSHTAINTIIQQTIDPSSQYPKGESNIHLLSANPKNDAILYGYTTLRHRAALAPAPVLLYKSVDKGKNWFNITPSGYRYLGGDFIFDTDNHQLIFSIFAKTEQGSSVKTVDENLVMKSDDGGTSWQALSIPATNTTKYDVTHVHLDPVDKKTLYANISTKNETDFEQIKSIAKSVDSGKSWDIIDTSPYFPGRIIVDPNNNQKLFMTSTQGIFRSSNGGRNWILNNVGIRHIGGKLSVAQNDSQVMYLVGIALGSIVNNRDAARVYYKTVNGGQHWDSFQTSSVVTGSCREFKVNPKNHQDIFCLTSENIYQSLDGGTQWTHLKASDSHQLVRAQNGSTIYLADGSGTSKSEDNGKNWTIISTINEGEITVHPQNQTTLYYILANQLYSSIDGGEQWLKLETPDNTGFNHLLIHPKNPDLMVLYDTYGLLLTTDAGKNWQIVLETLNNGDAEINSFPAEFDFISQFVIHPTDTHRFFVKTNTGIYESTDKGQRWEKRNSGIENHSSSHFLAINLHSSPDNVFVDTATGIFKLSKKVNYTAVSECILNWTEQNNPALFPASLVNSERWNGYTYRYYSQTNTYLGIFHEQEVHQLQPDKSSYIIPQDSIASYQNQSGCTDMHFQFSGNRAKN